MRTSTLVFVVSLALVTAFWLCIDALKEWQALVGSLLALAAAAVTVWVILEQIESEKAGVDRQIEAERAADEALRERRLLAHRALLPESLSRITRYAQESAEVTNIAIVALRANQNPRPALNCPNLPDRVLDDLRFLIENLDQENAVAVADLVSCYQVQHARLVSEIECFSGPPGALRQRIVTEGNLEHTYEKTVELGLRVDRMWDFAEKGSQRDCTAPKHYGGASQHVPYTRDLRRNGARVPSWSGKNLCWTR